VAKAIAKKIKLQIPAGKATPAPPVGTVLGPAGINLQEFCTRFNDATKDKMGDVLPVEITLYEDRSYDFKLKTPPTAFLLKKAAKINKASSKGATETVATISKSQLKEIAEIKKVDLNAYDIEAAMKIIEGTARNMGIKVEE
jgi:large subunit ribosomal protein L11